MSGSIEIGLASSICSGSMWKFEDECFANIFDQEWHSLTRTKHIGKKPDGDLCHERTTDASALAASKTWKCKVLQQLCRNWVDGPAEWWSFCLPQKKILRYPQYFVTVVLVWRYCPMYWCIMSIGFFIPNLFRLTFGWTLHEILSITSLVGRSLQLAAPILFPSGFLHSRATIRKVVHHSIILYIILKVSNLWIKLSFLKSGSISAHFSVWIHPACGALQAKTLGCAEQLHTAPLMVCRIIHCGCCSWGVATQRNQYPCVVHICRFEWNSELNLITWNSLNLSYHTHWRSFWVVLLRGQHVISAEKVSGPFETDCLLQGIQ